MATSSRIREDEDRRKTARARLGRTIRDVRKTQGRTLANVAKQAGISTSLLSQVENGLVDPSLDSLRDIADALGVPPFRLLTDNSHASRVVRAGQGRTLSLPGSDVELYLLSPPLESPFEVVRWKLTPGGVTAREPRSHPGIEAMLILSGSIRLEIGDEVIDLHEGDFFTADARVPHRARAISSEAAEGLFVLSPPYF